MLFQLFKYFSKFGISVNFHFTVMFSQLWIKNMKISLNILSNSFSYKFSKPAFLKPYVKTPSNFNFQSCPRHLPNWWKILYAWKIEDLLQRFEYVWLSSIKRPRKTMTEVLTIRLFVRILPRKVVTFQSMNQSLHNTN